VNTSLGQAIADFEAFQRTMSHALRKAQMEIKGLEVVRDTNTRLQAELAQAREEREAAMERARAAERDLRTIRAGLAKFVTPGS
jgi:hypothetical protein